MTTIVNTKTLRDLSKMITQTGLHVYEVKIKSHVKWRIGFTPNNTKILVTAASPSDRYALNQARRTVLKLITELNH